MRTFVTDRQTDGQTDGAGFIRTRERVLTSKLEVDPPIKKESNSRRQSIYKV